MKVPFRLVDVFSDRPLAGNQLCVVTDATGLDSDSMLRITREIGFSETAFVEDAGGDRYRARIFTPGGELPFAGHPTLGTAFVLVSEGRVTSPVTQSVKAGEFVVDVDPARGFATMRQLAPTFGDELLDTSTVAQAAGVSRRDLDPDLPPQVVSTGLGHLMVAVTNKSAVEHAEPHHRALAHLLTEVEADGCYLFALTASGARARMFSPELGIVEDAATGSAAGPLGAYLSERGEAGMPGHLEISQGEEMGRPSTLHVDVERDGETWGVSVGGGVFLVGEGSFDLVG